MESFQALNEFPSHLMSMVPMPATDLLQLLSRQEKFPHDMHGRRAEQLPDGKTLVPIPRKDWMRLHLLPSPVFVLLAIPTRT